MEAAMVSLRSQSIWGLLLSFWPGGLSHPLILWPISIGIMQQLSIFRLLMGLAPARVSLEAIIGEIVAHLAISTKEL